MNNYNNFLAMISTEFHRYLMENTEFANNIPANALVIFQIKGEDAFSHWHRETSLKNREVGQPVIYVHVKKWRKHSLIEEVNLVGIS